LRLRHIIAVAGFGAALLVGEAHAASAANGPRSPEDPWEKINRRFYATQQNVSRLFVPAGALYHFLTPGPVGVAIHNMVLNLGEPPVIANHVLQGRLRDAAREILRVALNSTVGIGGAIDVATPNGLPRKDNDFGVTLGRWGLGAGPYLYLPLIGPSTVRDLAGAGVDVALNPLTWTRFPGHATLAITSTVVGGLDRQIRAAPQLEAIISTAADPYATLRSVYLQNREAQIRGEAAPPVLEPMEDEPSANPPATSPSSSEPSSSVPAPEAPPTPDASPANPSPPAAPPLAPSAAAGAGFALAVATDPDAPIATARNCDLVGVATAPHGA
jgi:phospholipid-binding lipoprotein MlaA